MAYELDLRGFEPAPAVPLGDDFSGTAPDGRGLSVNSAWLEQGGRPFFAVSGEIHYSRMDPRRWEDELIKTRMGGINIVSAYLFWNHIEEEEGVFDFTGCRDVRRFVQLCAKQGLQVILRVGPFDHGEARNGGLPDWLYGKPFEVRHTNEGFMRYVRRLYTKIGGQVRGLFYRDGGPIIGVQLDNEYEHSSAVWEVTTGVSNEWIFGGNEGEKYLLKLRELALESGLTPVFFTGTAWGGAAYSPRILPLWGGYAYWPWIFYSHSGEHPATPGYVYEDYHHTGKVCADDYHPRYDPAARPYACCEMGGGMMCCYNYRFQLDYRSVDAMANIKLGSGCNFIGYYMYHGGTHPLGHRGAYLNEAQVARRSYDYQAPLGEFGQTRPSYGRLKTIHFFTRFFGERLAPMETVLPEGASAIDPRDAETLRFAVRTDGRSGFLFLNNFQDHFTLPDRKDREVLIRTADAEYRYTVSLASGDNAILPFRFDMDGMELRQATAQPVLRTTLRGRQTWVFMAPEGTRPEFVFEDGVSMEGTETAFTIRKEGMEADVLVLSRDEADRLYLLRDGSLVLAADALLEDDTGLRLETVREENTLYCLPADRLAGSPALERAPDEGGFGVYRLSLPRRVIPVTAEETAPHRFVLHLSESDLEGLKDARLRIDYRGDIGSLFLNGEMISDNFCNNAVWEVGLAEHREALRLDAPVLKIAPVREGARVSVESSMAGRNETVKNTVAQLRGVSIQPVYEVRL